MSIVIIQCVHYLINLLLNGHRHSIGENQILYIIKSAAKCITAAIAGEIFICSLFQV